MSVTSDSTLANPEQLIADLQRQLAEREAELAVCKAERDEALDQQTATAEVLQVINSSPGDLTPVFDAILEKAHAICGADLGSFAINNGERMPSVATRGYSEEHARLAGEGLPTNGENGQRLARGEIVHHDLRQRVDGPDRTANAIRHAAVELTGSRTYLGVPLRKDGALLGYLSAHRREVRPFSDKEIALLQNFAAQAVIAMENARLLGELRERTRDLEEALEYQTATSDVLKVISRSTSDVQPVLDTVVETAVRLCSSDTGAIWIREGEVYRYMSFSAVKTEPEYHAALRQRTIVPGRDTSIAARVALEGKVVHVEDIRADPDYALPGTVASGRRTMLGVPLLRDSEPIGVIALSRKRVQPFTERQIELVRTFADQAVIAMENARLLGELRQRTGEVAELNRGLEAGSRNRSRSWGGSGG
jgi:GAF domain-containing protein